MDIALNTEKNRADSSEYSTSRSLNVLYSLKKTSRASATELTTTAAIPPAPNTADTSVTSEELKVQELLFTISKVWHWLFAETYLK